MADTLLLPTTVLAVKISEHVSLPQGARTNSHAVKAITEILKYASPEILFAGDGAIEHDLSSNIIENSDTIARIHVIEAPVALDSRLSDEDKRKWFLKQLRSSKKHIVIKSEVKIGLNMHTVIDIYVRGIFIAARHTTVHTLYQNQNRLNYAV